MPPPRRAVLREDGRELDLELLAGRVADRHLERHPEDVTRYGAGLAREWCVHDVQHILNWAVHEANGDFPLADRLAWLAGVLDARGYPVANLVSCVETTAEVAGPPLSPLLREGAARLREAAAGGPPGSVPSHPR
jgi:hypothetical protein